ncbi:MAG: hypothetical protein H6739_39860 [Alphaproteobacteria bacterium]|nr:hypothetical protein [Alphaproteobacteria bacterium]
MPAVFLLLLGCLPIPEHHRPPLDGQVLRGDAPLAGATVEACTWSTWEPFRCDAPLHAVTDDQGHFTLPGWSTGVTPLLGESPLFETVLTVCDEAGRAVALVGAGRDPVTVQLTLGGPLVRAADPFRTSDEEAEAAGAERCAAR